MRARPLLFLVALAGLAACSDGLTVAVGDRLIYDSNAGQAAAAAPVAGAAATGGPAPAANQGGGPGFQLPTITSNIPVYVGDRQVAGPGPSAP